MTDNELLLAINRQLETISNRLDTMDNRLDTMDNRLDTMDNRFDKTDNRFDKMDKRFDKMEDTLNTIKFKQDHMSEKLNGLELTVKYSDHNIRCNIRNLHEDIDTIVEILRIHDMIPIAK